MDLMQPSSESPHALLLLWVSASMMTSSVKDLELAMTGQPVGKRVVFHIGKKVLTRCEVSSSFISKEAQTLYSISKRFHVYLAKPREYWSNASACRKQPALLRKKGLCFS